MIPSSLKPISPSLADRPKRDLTAAWRFIAGLSIIWMVMAGVDLLIFWLHGRQPGVAAWASAALEFKFAAFEVAAAAYWAALFGAVAAVVASTTMLGARFIKPIRPISALLTAGLVTVVAAIPVLLFSLSWGAFWKAGSFLDRDAIFLWLQLVHPFRALEAVSAWITWGVPAAALVATMLGAKVLRWGIRRVPAQGLWTITSIAVLLALVSIVVAAWPNRVDPPATGGQVNELLSPSHIGVGRTWEVRRYGTGPCAAAMLEITGVGSPDNTEPVASAEIPITYRPHVTMGDYLKHVDRTAQARPRWNVVFIIVESMRADVLMMYGGRRQAMPNVDALASESQVFLNAYTQATHSNYAVACPLSGEYPLRSSRQYAYNGGSDFPRVMIYDVLKAADHYRVGLFSSANERWFGINRFLDTPSVDKFQDSETWGGQTLVFDQDTAFAQWARQTHAAGVVDDRNTVQSTMDWIDAQPRDVPFFASLYLQSSHFPYWVPPDFPRKFSPQQAGFEMNFNAYPPDKAAAVRDRYDDSLHYADAQLGKLFDHLRATGQWNRTVVVLTGDHGQAFYEHGFPTHANMVFNELLRVPLLFRVPGQEPTVETYPAQHVDIPSSTLHLLGLPPHPSYQGIDLFDVAARPPSDRRSIFSMVQTPLSEEYAVIRGPFKFVYDKRFDAGSLYNIVKDPGERNDLLNAESDRSMQMLNRLNTWRAVQLQYYSNALHQAEAYAPVLSDQ